MKTASTTLHLIALAACFSAHLAFAHELDGIRRALQTMAAIETHMMAAISSTPATGMTA